MKWRVLDVVLFVVPAMVISYHIADMFLLHHAEEAIAFFGVGPLCLGLLIRNWRKTNYGYEANDKKKNEKTIEEPRSEDLSQAEKAKLYDETIGG